MPSQGTGLSVTASTWTTPGTSERAPAATSGASSAQRRGEAARCGDGGREADPGERLHVLPVRRVPEDPRAHRSDEARGGAEERRDGRGVEDAGGHACGEASYL